jgi:hypothetical protein
MVRSESRVWAISFWSDRPTRTVDIVRRSFSSVAVASIPRRTVVASRYRPRLIRMFARSINAFWTRSQTRARP